VPLLQAAHAPTPPMLAVPTAQGAHVEALVAPTAADAVPGGQRRQDSEPKPG